MKTLLFLDLDDTVFQTQAKCLHDHGCSEALEPTAFLENGLAHGFSTPPQRQFLQLMRGVEIIPTTARHTSSYQRVKLDIPPPNWVILNHGGTILDPSSQPHPVWSAHMQGIMRPWLSHFEDLNTQINQWAAQHAPGLHARLIGDHGQIFYVLVKDRDKQHPISLPRLRDELLAAWLEPHPELTLHHNGNNLTVMPKNLDKAHAVRFLLEHYRREHPELLVLGAGDSQSDADFLQLCDYALIPKHAQLMRNLAQDS
jgi:hydroxymethylpyrimidine pyrophosphatase-like HAD family hydrolase